MIIERIIEPVVALPRAVKKFIAVCIDASLCLLTIWLAFYLRLNEWVPLSDLGWPALWAVLIAIPIFVAFGLYRAVFRYLTWEALTLIAQAVFFYGLIYASIFTAWGINGVPRTIGIMQPALLLIAVASTRVFGRYWLLSGNRRSRRPAIRKNVLIYGAGSSGRQLAAAFAESSDTKIVGFIDDAPGLIGSLVAGIRVWGSRALTNVVEQLEVSEIYLAIPSASQQRRNQILQELRSLGVAVRTLPGLLDIANGRVSVNDVRSLEIEDLLGRDAVVLDQQLLQKNILGKTVLVTGAGGSIGSELCRQILAVGPAKLLLVDSSEFALYSVHRDLSRFPREDGIEHDLVPLLGSVTDQDRMLRILQAWRPDTIFHAAAYKHVPLVEHNPLEGMRNNAIGTLRMAELAVQQGVKNFVLISTDKAVRPTNIMGATKRLAELVLQALAAEQATTCFSMVRFGNVLGSSGSVVPLFREQIRQGGPVTITHPEITRYFMTIPEAAQLVVQASAMASGGEVFVLDMGQPVRIIDLARNMIELSGRSVRSEDNPDGDIEIAIVGMRPGEKLYEELLIGDNSCPTSQPRIMMANEHFLPWRDLKRSLEELDALIEIGDVAQARALLCALVAEYMPSSEIVDWIANLETAASLPLEASPGSDAYQSSTASS